MSRTEPRRHEAHVNITLNGQNGDMADPVPFDATDKQLKRWSLEAIRSGTVAGITPHVGPRSLDGYVIDRFPATASVPVNRIFIRPRTPFG